MPKWLADLASSILLIKNHLWVPKKQTRKIKRHKTEEIQKKFWSYFREEQLYFYNKHLCLHYGDKQRSMEFTQFSFWKNWEKRQVKKGATKIWKLKKPRSSASNTTQKKSKFPRTLIFLPEKKLPKNFFSHIGKNICKPFSKASTKEWKNTFFEKFIYDLCCVYSLLLSWYCCSMGYLGKGNEMITPENIAIFDVFQQEYSLFYITQVQSSRRRRRRRNFSKKRSFKQLYKFSAIVTRRFPFFTILVLYS